jgi:hypothetical protein
LGEEILNQVTRPVHVPIERARFDPVEIRGPSRWHVSAAYVATDAMLMFKPRVNRPCRISARREPESTCSARVSDHARPAPSTEFDEKPLMSSLVPTVQGQVTPQI